MQENVLTNLYGSLMFFVLGTIFVGPKHVLVISPASPCASLSNGFLGLHGALREAKRSL
jgi:hypothetical protein